MKSQPGSASSASSKTSKTSSESDNNPQLDNADNAAFQIGDKQGFEAEYHVDGNSNLNNEEEEEEIVNMEEEVSEEEEEEEMDEEEEDEEDDDMTEDDEETSWVDWFCGLEGNEIYVQVESEFIDDDFNLTGLNSIVPYYNEALEMIRDCGPEGSFTESALQIIEASAELLYSLIHQRFLLTKRGTQLLYEKYKARVFGVCARTLCEGQHCFPIGLSDLPNKHTMKIFCPRCLDIYQTSSKYTSVDGCAFGTSAIPMFLLPAISGALRDLYNPNENEATGSNNALSHQNTASSDISNRFMSGNYNTSSSNNNAAGTNGSSTVTELKQELIAGWSRYSVNQYDESNGVQESGIYTPKIFGFKIHQSSPTAPRMAWLRTRRNPLIQQNI